MVQRLTLSGVTVLWFRYATLGMVPQKEQSPARFLDLHSLDTGERLSAVEGVFESVYNCVLGSFHPFVKSTVIVFA